MSSVAEKLQRKSERRPRVQSPNSKQVRLRLVYIDFWSAVKLSFLVSLCVGIAQVVVAFLVWLVLNSTGIFSQLNNILSDILGNESFSVFDTLSLSKVMIFSAILGLLTAVIGTFLGAIASLLYNLSVRLTGGLLVGFTNN